MEIQGGKPTRRKTSSSKLGAGHEKMSQGKIPAAIAAEWGSLILPEFTLPVSGLKGGLHEGPQR